MRGGEEGKFPNLLDGDKYMMKREMPMSNANKAKIRLDDMKINMGGGDKAIS